MVRAQHVCRSCAKSADDAATASSAAFVALDPLELLGIDCSSSSLPNEIDSINWFHTSLHESDSNQKWSPAQASYAVHGNRVSFAVLSRKFVIDQVKPEVESAMRAIAFTVQNILPSINYFVRGGLAIQEWQIKMNDPGIRDRGCVVLWFTSTDQCRNGPFFQHFDVIHDVFIRRSIHNDESILFVCWLYVRRLVNDNVHLLWSNFSHDELERGAIADRRSAFWRENCNKICRCEQLEILDDFLFLETPLRCRVKFIFIPFSCNPQYPWRRKKLSK